MLKALPGFSPKCCVELRKTMEDCRCLCSVSERSLFCTRRNTETLALTGEACRFYRPVVQLLLLLLLIVFIRDLGDVR